MASFSSFPCSCTQKYLIALLLVFSMYFQNLRMCDAFQTFDLEIHHRFSDQVKAIMGGDNLPEKGSLQYYAAMTHRDKFFRGRALAENNDDDSKLLPIETSQIASSLGALHYANVSLGTPSLSFLVALDTGTNLLWVPCDDCTNCTRNLMTSHGVEINLNIYNINSSSSSKYISCNSSLCDNQEGCSKPSSQCPYNAVYNNYTTSSGVLVEDVLRLKTNHQPEDIDAKITFGCGQVQTGFYLDGRARNGIFGLGIGNKSVPSILASQELVADSFSLCFGSDGAGRISFGDKGSTDHEKTPFNLIRQDGEVSYDAWYNISFTHLSVGGNLSDLMDVSAAFYSSAEYTYLNDPAYTALCDRFDSQTPHKRLSSEPNDLFEYCYDVGSDSTEFLTPNVTLIMKGGGHFNVDDPTVPIRDTNGTVTGYCLGVVNNTPNENFFGNNFMTGQHIVFDREKSVLGWMASNCTDAAPKQGEGNRETTTNTTSMKKNKVLTTILLSVGSSVLLFAVIICFIIWMRRRRGEGINLVIGDKEDMQTEDLELPVFDLITIETATNNFCPKNKIGEGGFGSVYKGNLEEGEEIAVKRLSKNSGQGLGEFRNEVILIAKLQHRNLVKLLGCCIQGKERMLVYEYMPNESLDYFIFDQNKSKLMNWEKRWDIVKGIARGLLYLHEDSRLRIIHRDLKASNILLDSNMNPKISDFGMARLFGGDQMEANTERVVGTYGYMSPEYAIDGHFSTKSDVFSFGVLVLEIVSGKKNRGFYNGDHHHTLLGHAWMLWRDGKNMLELMDPCLEDPSTSASSEVLKCIQVGLLCVQQLPDDRPSMSSVVFMLGSEIVVLPQPKQPGFFVERSCSDASITSYQKTIYASTSSNSETQVTIPGFEGR